MSSKGTQQLGSKAAYQLANVTKTKPQYGVITPRWLVRLLDWKGLEAGIFRVNKVTGEKSIEAICSQENPQIIPNTFVNYEEAPREYILNSLSMVLDVPTKISDIYSAPYDQTAEQVRLGVETIKELQESQLINNPDYGLLHNVPAAQRIKTRKGSPTPDDLDALIGKVWKEPSLFLAHPSAIEAFGRECTRRGVPPPTATLFGAQFLTWRGIPLVPTDKLRVDSKTNKTNILLLRIGEKKQGVVGLFQQGLPGEQTPGLSVRFMGINIEAVASYLISLYCSAAILTDDAIGLLEQVEIGNFHDYKWP